MRSEMKKTMNDNEEVYDRNMVNENGIAQALDDHNEDAAESSVRKTDVANGAEQDASRYRRRHMVEHSEVVLGKKTFHVTSVFPAAGSDEASESVSDKVFTLLGKRKS